ncbi:hypothetical protein ABIA10_007429 [Rhizobium leguminosarum]
MLGRNLSHINFMLWSRAKFWLGRKMLRECKINSTLLLTTDAGKIDPHPGASNILYRLWLYVFRRRFLDIH